MTMVLDGFLARSLPALGHFLAAGRLPPRSITRPLFRSMILRRKRLKRLGRPVLLVIRANRDEASAVLLTAYVVGTLNRIARNLIVFLFKCYVNLCRYGVDLIKAIIYFLIVDAIFLVWYGAAILNDPEWADGYELRLMSSAKDVPAIPTEGKSLVIVAAVDHALHFRFFDNDGKMVVDIDVPKAGGTARMISESNSRICGRPMN